MTYKQVIVVREDLNLPKGKLAVQVAHAAVSSALNASKVKLLAWRLGGQKKVVLKVPTQTHLERYMSLFKKYRIKCVLISDAGKTVVEPGTVTCIGAGPEKADKLDKVTGRLKML